MFSRSNILRLTLLRYSQASLMASTSGGVRIDEHLYFKETLYIMIILKTRKVEIM